MTAESTESKAKKIIIVGGVAGGMSAAARLRRLDENLDITVYEKGKYVSFANCGLPYYIGGVIADRDRLFVQTPEAIYDRYRIEVRISHEVVSINPGEKTVTVKNLDTGEEFTDSYDKLILSPGAKPIKPPLSGIDSGRVFTLRNVNDTDKIKSFIDERKPKRAVVVGGGFIGIEMAENLANRGVRVDIVEMAEQILLPLDFELAARVEKHLRDKGVNVHVKNGVAAFSEDEDEAITVKLQDGHEIKADFAILSIGVSPNSELAQKAGLELGVRKTIKVNDYLQTSDNDIYAVGDVIEVTYIPTGKPANIALAGPAAKQGRIAANNIVFGNKSVYKGTVGTAVIKAFGLEIASTGASARLLEKEGIKYESVTVHTYNHAGYYPEAKPITIKVLFSPESGKILGGQSVGYEGVAKQIDVLSLAIQHGVSVTELKDFEHAYAPQFSSAKAPLNMVGFISDNILSGLVKTISWRELMEKKGEMFVLDVRTPEEFAAHKIEGATNIPLDELRERLSELPKDKKIAVYCRVGMRGYLGTRILLQNGFNAYNLEGGLKTYMDATEELSYEDVFGEEFDMGMHKTLATDSSETADAGEVIELDACGLSCPGPIVKLKETMDTLSAGSTVLVKATDPGFKNDVEAWAKATGNTLVSVDEEDGVIRATIRKETHGQTTSRVVGENDKTIIVFDNDLDKVIASFIIANGALAMGRKVTMFFTFWGLSVLLKEKPPKGLKKNAVEKAFGVMLPRGSKELKLSQMNMGGMGAKMIRGLMKKKNVGSLEDLIEDAIKHGVRMIACQTSMELMGIKKEELIDGVEVGGVAQYLEASEHASGNLFI